MKSFLLSLSFLFASNTFALNEGLFMGDMLVFPEQIENLPVDADFQPQAAMKAKVELWTDGVFPFEFEKDVTPQHAAQFVAACKEWADTTGIKCLLGEYKGNVVKVGRWTEGCWSTWGMNQGSFGMRRRINLDEGCWYHPTMMHEIGHNLGLIHEHQRPDRDKYVQVFTKNVEGVFFGANKKINFCLQKSQSSSAYDFLSIMHYDRKAFSKNGQDTILPKAGFEQFADVMGRQMHLSEQDIAFVKKIYFPAN